MIKLAVFDWNGTIFSDISLIVAASNQEFASISLPPITVALVRQHFEVPIQNYYRNMGITAEQLAQHGPDMHAAFHTYYDQHVHRARTRPGARAMLRALHDRGTGCIILSNHHVAGICKQLQRLKLEPYFDAVLANDDIHGSMTLGKQHRLATFLETSHFTPAETAIIGDTIEEIAIGRSLGLKTIAISGGMSSVRRLRAAQPDVLISSLRGLINAIEEL